MRRPWCRTDAASTGRPEQGQAMIETILMTWGLFMVVAIMIQVFLIDQHAFRLATRAHARLFQQEAYPNNSPGVRYDGRARQRLEGPDEWVPVINYFRLYGLTEEDLRIRSTRDDRQKEIHIGRGTKADIAAGLEGLADPALLLAVVEGGMQLLEGAKATAQQAQSRGGH